MIQRRHFLSTSTLKACIASLFDVVGAKRRRREIFDILGIVKVEDGCYTLRWAPDAGVIYPDSPGIPTPEKIEEYEAWMRMRQLYKCLADDVVGKAMPPSSCLQYAHQCDVWQIVCVVTSSGAQRARSTCSWREVCKERQTLASSPSRKWSLLRSLRRCSGSSSTFEQLRITTKTIGNYLRRRPVGRDTFRLAVCWIALVARAWEGHCPSQSSRDLAAAWSGWMKRAMLS